MYAKLVQESLENHEKLRIRFYSSGKLVAVEVLKNGQWVLSEKLTNVFLEFTAQSLNLNREMSMVVEK